MENNEIGQNDNTQHVESLNSTHVDDVTNITFYLRTL